MEHYLSTNKFLRLEVPPGTLVIVVPYMELRYEQMFRSAIRYHDPLQEEWRTRLVVEIEMALMANYPPPDLEQ